MRDLYVANSAAQRVADECRRGISELEALRREAIATFQADLGMGDCEEGRQWNRLLNTLISSGEEGSLLAAIDGMLAELRERAEWAEIAQREFDSTEHRSAESYRKLTASADVYPHI